MTSSWAVRSISQFGIVKTENKTNTHASQKNDGQKKQTSRDRKLHPTLLPWGEKKGSTERFSANLNL